MPTPQLVRQATSRGTSSGHLIADWTDTVDHSLKVATPAPCPIGFPSRVIRRLPSSRTPERMRSSVVAEVLHARRAPATCPAHGEKGEHHSFAHLPSRRIGPDLLHNPGAFVTAGEGQSAGGYREVAGQNVIVGVAEAGGRPS